MENNKLSANEISAHIDDLLLNWDYGKTTLRVKVDVLEFSQHYDSFTVTKMKDKKSTVIVMSGNIGVNDEVFNISIVVTSGYPYKAPKIFILDELQHYDFSYLRKNKGQVRNKFLKKWGKSYLIFLTNNYWFIDVEKSNDLCKLNTALDSVIACMLKDPPSKKISYEKDDSHKVKSPPEDREMMIALLTSKIDNKLIEYSKHLGECESRWMQSFVQMSFNRGKLDKAKVEITERWDNLVAEVEKKKNFRPKQKKPIDYAMPEDEVSKKLLNIAAAELALEDWLSEAKSCYRRKLLSLEEYLDQVRSLSEKQFKNIATKRKIMAYIS